MELLEYFGIGNFKAFQHLTQFDLKPVTILVGTNSSGKSSLSKGLLAMKDSFSEVNIIGTSDFNNREIANLQMRSLENLIFPPMMQLGNYSTCLNNNNDSTLITFQYPVYLNVGRLSDRLILQIVYNKSENILKSGTLKLINIIHEETGIELLKYDFNDSYKVGASNSKKGELIRKDMRFIGFNVIFKSGYPETLNINFSGFCKVYDLILQKVILFLDNQTKIITLVKEYLSTISNNEELFYEALIQLNKLIQYEYTSNITKDDTHKHLIEILVQQKIIYPEYDFQLNGKWHSQGDFQIYYLDPLFPMFLNDLKKNVEKKLSNNKKIKIDIPFTESEISRLAETLNPELFTKLVDLNNDLKSYSQQYKDFQGYLTSLVLECLDEYSLKNIPYPVKGHGQFSNLIKLILRSSSKELFRKFSDKDIALKSFFDFFKLEGFDEDFGVAFTDGDEDEYSGNNSMPYNISELFSNDYISNLRLDIYTFIVRAFNRLAEKYRNIYFIPAVRTKVDRFFSNVKEQSYLQALLYEMHQINLSEESESFINKYLQEFGIADFITLNVSEDGSWTKITLSKNEKEIELADVGYGVSQVLPIILQIGYLITINEINIPEDITKLDGFNSSMLIIEEPETNLHPALQSKLADMFVECSRKYNIQFILETHSEYLIRKLQYLTAKQEIKASDSIIYYFYDPEKVPDGERQVKKIEIRPDGSLTDDFGTGFFDEATNWKFELLQLRKSQKN